MKQQDFGGRLFGTGVFRFLFKQSIMCGALRLSISDSFALLFSGVDPFGDDPFFGNSRRHHGRADHSRIGGTFFGGFGFPPFGAGFSPFDPGKIHQDK